MSIFFLGILLTVEVLQQIPANNITFCEGPAKHGKQKKKKGRSHPGFWVYAVQLKNISRKIY